MIEIAITIFLGILGGAAVGMQGAIATQMSQRVGGAAGSFIIHLGGAIASLVLLLARGGEQIVQWRQLSWYMLGAGVLGLVLYLTLNQTFPKLGAASAITLIVVGQMLAGVLIDHFGGFGVQVRLFDLNRLLATALLIGGAYLMVK